jgi:hypothetical protein
MEVSNNINVNFFDLFRTLTLQSGYAGYFEDSSLAINKAS